MGSTERSETTFSGFLISSAETSSSCTAVSTFCTSSWFCIIRPPTRKRAPTTVKITTFRGVTTPRNTMTAPERYMTFGTPKSCFTRSGPKSASLPPLVTRIPVAREMRSEGMADTSPSPMVRMVYVERASPKELPLLSMPMAMPPTTLMPVIRSPAVESPLTYFTAPSMAPKKEDSCCILSLLRLASASSMAPVFRSASMAICLPGMASRVNLAVTSDTRSEPLFITTNCTMISMM